MTGRLIVGADVALAMWQVTRLVYDRFADVLFAWNRWKGHW